MQTLINSIIISIIISYILINLTDYVIATLNLKYQEKNIELTKQCINVLYQNKFSKNFFQK